MTHNNIYNMQISEIEDNIIMNLKTINIFENKIKKLKNLNNKFRNILYEVKNIKKEYPEKIIKIYREDKCVICLENKSEYSFICGHLCLCEICSGNKFDKCIICKR